MARMADILRKVRELKTGRDGQPDNVSVASSADSVVSAMNASVVSKQDIQQLMVSRRRKERPDSSEAERTLESIGGEAASTDAAGIYTDLSQIMRDLFARGNVPAEADVRRIRSMVRSVIDMLAVGDMNLYATAYSMQAAGLDYLAAHSLLVFLYSLSMGRGAGYGAVQLEELATAALLHDIGMQQLADLAVKADELTDADIVRLRQHAALGADILSRWPGLPDIVRSAVHQHHERSDASGYPQALGRHSICEYAKIIGLVDAYVFLIRPRFPASGTDPVTAIKTVLEDKKRFSQRLLKLLVERISVFPAGSRVELNTGERAVVTRLNYENPLRPEVRIDLDAAGERLLQPKVLDLMRHPTIFVRAAIQSGSSSGG